MKRKQFYDHLVSLDSIHIELEELELSGEEKRHLKDLAYANLHIVILDTVLTHLTTEDKEAFLKHIEDSNHETLWNFLKERKHDIEDHIKVSAQNLINEFLEDIKGEKNQK